MLGAVDLPQVLVERLLDRWPVARLATLGREGPHQVPVVFARTGALLWSPVDGKPKAGAELARVRHVRAEPRVSLLLDHYEPDWRCLWWLRISGAARVVEPSGGRADAEPDAAVAALRAKYPQYLSVSVLREPPTLIRVETVRVRSWCAGDEALARASALLEARS
jgi:PPOX class probable F420-dependent enzyme